MKNQHRQLALSRDHLLNYLKQHDECCGHTAEIMENIKD